MPEDNDNKNNGDGNDTGQTTDNKKVEAMLQLACRSDARRSAADVITILWWCHLLLLGKADVIVDVWMLL